MEDSSAEGDVLSAGDAHDYVMGLPIAEVVRELTEMLGATTVAVIAGVSETRAVSQWMTGREPQRPHVLRFALQVTKTIAVTGDREYRAPGSRQQSAAQRLFADATFAGAPARRRSSGHRVGRANFCRAFRSRSHLGSRSPEPLRTHAQRGSHSRLVPPREAAYHWPLTEPRQERSRRGVVVKWSTENSELDFIAVRESSETEEILHVFSDVDIASSKAFDALLGTAPLRHKRMLVDLTECPYMDLTACAA